MKDVFTYEQSTVTPPRPLEDVERARTPAAQACTVSVAELQHLLHLTERDVQTPADLARWSRLLIIVCAQLERARMHIDGRLAELIVEGIEPPVSMRDHEAPSAFIRLQAD